MRLLGHKSPTVFLSYDVVAVDDLKRAVASVEKGSPPASGTSVVHGDPRNASDEETGTA
jgi:hypothetical protein